MQPAAPDPVTVYVVVEPGAAFTVAPVVALNPVEGDHEYVVAPLAVIFVLPPLQMVGVVAEADTLTAAHMQLIVGAKAVTADTVGVMAVIVAPPLTS